MTRELSCGVLCFLRFLMQMDEQRGELLIGWLVGDGWWHGVKWVW